MTDEPTIRYCLEHDRQIVRSDMFICSLSSGDGACRIVTLHRQTIRDLLNDHSVDLNAFIWTEEP